MSSNVSSAHDLRLTFPKSSCSLLVINYAVIGSLAIVASVIFYFSFRNLDREQDQLNAIKAGHLHRQYEEKEVAAH